MTRSSPQSAENPEGFPKFLDWMDEIESRTAAAKPTEFPLSEPDLEVIRAIYERMKQCEQEAME